MDKVMLFMYAYWEQMYDIPKQRTIFAKKEDFLGKFRWLRFPHNRGSTVHRFLVFVISMFMQNKTSCILKKKNYKQINVIEWNVQL